MVPGPIGDLPSIYFKININITDDKYFYYSIISPINNF